MMTTVISVAEAWNRWSRKKERYEKELEWCRRFGGVDTTKWIVTKFFKQTHWKYPWSLIDQWHTHSSTHQRSNFRLWTQYTQLCNWLEMVNTTSIPTRYIYRYVFPSSINIQESSSRMFVRFKCIQSNWNAVTSML